MRNLKQVAMFSCCVLLLAAPASNGASTLKLDVSPAISRAPGAVKVRVSVHPTPQGRWLHVTAESATYYTSSDVELDGAQSDVVKVFEFRDLPPGLYQVTGTLVDRDGGRTAAWRVARVEPQFGS